MARSSPHDKSVRLWDASTGACLQSLSIDKDKGVDELAFSPDGSRFYIKLFYSCSIYDTETYTHIEDVDAVSWAMSRQGDRIVTTTETDKARVKVWNATTGQELLAINEGQTQPGLVTFSPDGGEVLLTCEANETVSIYDSWTGQLRRTLRPSNIPRFVMYSPDGKHVVFVDEHKGVEVYGGKSGAFVGKVEGYGDNAKCHAAQLLPDGQTLLLHHSIGGPRGDDRHVHLYNIRDLVRIR
ncbi:uncharacterized protein PHACADRAFT_248929 [Phanerochaete carnosa HHB-10118-sp]|uniref:Anaphase-promoting complex subunit 4 WD40 domain-containing protein n=1 Tax=Phanerochaete carnosa (strain HHB-10118-sp) TaxID=650164 RepID=K5WIC5_PHACS|nr:uncharacterized protein PHACADRAFT_248929 [Phanerochaete carnosa HHB-10118-sp]EKM58834.1 hypothetical protein PHACADRAFT_248929 [Phanerochaete carnosa HHB-10118-sp]